MGKFQRDNKGMSEETSDKEVTKFLMDSEMVNAYIKYEKDKVTNPRDLKTEAEQNLSNPKTIATYLAWLVGGASIGVIRQNIIEPKFASGEWKEIHIGAPSWFMKPAVEAADSAVQVATDAMSTAAGGM